MPNISKATKEPNGRVQYSIALSPEETKVAEDRALEHMGQNARIAGFRPGKAPLEMLRGKVDDGQLLEEAVRRMLSDIIRSVVERDTLKPIASPKVDVTSRSPIGITLVFLERPEVSVKGLKKISIPKTEPKVDQKDVDRMVDYLRGQYRTTKVVDRPAKDGDQVTMNFKGSDAEGKEIPGTVAEGYKITLGSKSLIPGFEEGLVGLKKGDAKDLKLTFPAKYHAEHLQNKPANFAVTVTEVEEVSMPELTDAFVKENQMGESAAAFRTSLEKNLRDQEETMEKRRRESALFEAIRLATTADLAPELIEQEARAIAEDLGNQLQRQKVTLQQWLEQNKKTPEQLKNDLTEEGKKRLTLRFGLEKALEELEIIVTDDEMQGAIKEALDAMTDVERKEEEAHFEKGEHGYEDILWRKKIEKLLEKMLG